MSTKVLDIDLAQPLADITGLESHQGALVIVRWRSKPLGELHFDLSTGTIAAGEVRRRAIAELGYLLHLELAREIVNPLIGTPPAEPKLPSGSVIVCTRNRPDDLSRCLLSLRADPTAPEEIIVVDNDPSDDRAAQVARDNAAGYVVERRRGAGPARARGARAAEGEIVAYVDDDVLIDPGWGAAIRRPFTNPVVGAVSGLVLPLELETQAQQQFQRVCGFAQRGFHRREFTASTIPPVAAANVGAGASMALRRSLITELGLFDAYMGPGTPARSGEETYAFYRLLSCGHRLVYNPEAIVWHRHRRSQQELRRTLYGYSVGAYVVLLRCLLQHRESFALYAGLQWFLDHHVRQLWRGLMGRTGAQPVSLTLAEIRGALASPLAYLVTRSRERAFAREAAQT